MNIALTSNGATVFSDTAIQQERSKLEEKLNLKESQFVKGDPFTKPWYPFERKFLKQKLGSLYHCTIKEEDDGLCRVMNYDRISSYQIEAFFTELARIQLYKMSDYVMMPLGIHVSRKMEITVIMPELVSLHDFLH